MEVEGEYLYKEFAEDIKGNGFNSEIICAEKLGDTWSIFLEEENVLVNYMD